MKKLNQIVYSILICVAIFFLFDFIEFKIIEKKFYNNFKDVKIPVNSYFKYYDNNWFGHSITSYKEYYKKLSRLFRKDVVSNENKKPPILLFGCSFAYGSQLKEHETFAYKISQLTKRDVYNKALECCGIQHMYYLLSHKDFYNNLPQNPEYAIFIYIPTQLTRLNNYIFPSEMLVNGPYLHYDIKNGFLKLRKEPTKLYKSFLFKRLLSKIDEINDCKNESIKLKNMDLAVKLFTESKNLLQEKYPNIKFIILDFNSETGGDKQLENPQMWEKLKDNDFIIINSKELTGKIFTQTDTTNDKIHPNETVWNLLIPPLVEKLNL